jgi:DNA-binding PadR family transcriptional regulator
MIPRELAVGKGFLTYSTTVILQAVASGYRYGFDIIDLTGMPGGTVYPALRRLEDAGCLTSKWEEPSVARTEPRPARKYYELTRRGRDALAEAVKRYRLLDRAQPKKARQPKPSRA